MPDTATGGSAKEPHAPGLHDIGPRLLVTAAALVAAQALLYIPAPGIDPAVFSVPEGSLPLDPQAAARASIGALGFNPVYSALIASELLRLASPSLAQWQRARAVNGYAFNRYMLMFAMALAALQGWGIATALQGILGEGRQYVEQPGWLFGLSFALTQMAGLAFLVLMADVITRYGIGSGYWVILVGGEVAALADVLPALWGNYVIGQLGMPALLALTAITAVSIMAVVLLYRGSAGGLSRKTHSDAADILMPAFIGVALASMAFGLMGMVSFLTGSGPPQSHVHAAQPAHLVLVSAAIFLIAVLRASQTETGSARHGAVRRAILVAAVSSAIVIALQLMSQRTNTLLISGDMLIALVLVCLVILPARVEPLVRRRLHPG